MVLLEPDVPVAVTISLSRSPVKGVVFGVFSAEGEALRFHQAIVTREAIAKVQAEVRERVLRLFKRRKLLSPEDVDMMRQWEHEGGFSLNADGSPRPCRVGTVAPLLRPTHLCQRAAAVDREGSATGLPSP